MTERDRGTCQHCERRDYLCRPDPAGRRRVRAHWIVNRTTFGARVKCAGSGEVCREDREKGREP